MASSSATTANQDHAFQVIKKYKTYVDMIVEVNISDESKLNAAQEISENFEVIIISPHYAGFLEYAIPRFLQLLREGEPQFIAEGVIQQLRKLILEIIHRIPTNDHLRPHYKNILTAMFHLLESENEENVLVCLRIIIELHRQFRPPMQSEIQHFLHFVKNIYKELPNNIKSSFEVVNIPVTGYLSAEVNGGSTAAPSTPSTTALNSPNQTTKSIGDLTMAAKGGQQQTVIPKAVTSLKVLAELPIIVVLLFQLYKQNVLGEIRDFIPLIIKTIVLQPSLQARNSPSFNKEVYVDFVAAQIKTLSFLAFIIRAYQEYVNNYSEKMVGGMLGLFRYCPQEVAHLRKELLIAARHILVTDLRNRFVPHIDQLFDEDVLIGSGWTAREALRPLAYSTLADLVHHVRSHLPLHHLSLAVHLFSKNVHDESLPVSIQTMSCKLLLNLVEGIRKSDEQGTGREILMRMLEVFVRKFHSIAMHELPVIMEKCEKKVDSNSNNSKEPAASETTSQAQKISLPSFIQESDSYTIKKSGDIKGTTFSAADCKSMVKTLVCGVKTITWGAGSCRDVTTTPQAQGTTEKLFLPQETPLFSRLLKYALQALDIYQIVQATNGTYYIRTPNSQQIRMKEEKEILEHFAGVFTMLNTNTFKEVFQENIEYLVERIHANFALQIIPNSFLANPHTSATFATILMQFLLNKLDEMGTNVENSNLYLKLFKLVFGSVSLFASENELMLKPHLHEVVNRSMELACTSKEPYNYFLLLRALFRSIGGGNHDLLYQEFLPLLPNLLQGLNNLQSGVHRQYMKDLFVELCLTVPVRLSSLLPYLPMLMDPLVSALNGSQTLVSQGLRTLELCVDNLQPDFLYDHIQPVRAELFQALWKTLRNQSDSIAHVAFRVLGKFGGGNRRMLKEPQKLGYDDMDSTGPCISIFFPESNSAVILPVSSVIESALNELKSAPAPAPQPTTSQQQQQQTNSQALDNTAFYRKQAWIVIQSFLATVISFEDSAHVFEELLSHESFKTGTPPITGKTARPPTVDEATKQTLKNALLGMLVASSVADIKDDVIPFLCHIVRHYTILGVAQQAGPCGSKPSTSPQGTDVHVMIDAIASVMMLEEKELCTTGELAVAVMRETASLIMGDLYKALQLPLFEYLVEKLCECCYERAWFAKAGGCTSVAFLMKTMPLKWVIEHQLPFAKALMFIMMDLTDEVSAGTVDSAKETLEKLIRQCNAQDQKDEEIAASQERCGPTLLQHLVREVVSSNSVVREQAQYSLTVLSEISGKTVHEIMEPHKGLLEDMMPPKKHLLRHQSVNMQIALMDGNTFCANLEPRLFSLDLTTNDHKIFFKELLFLCEADDAQLQKLPCYKHVQKFSELRTKALYTMAAYHYIPQVRDTIFNSLYKALNSSVSDVQDAGNEALKKFLAKSPPIEPETVQQAIRPLFLLLGDHRTLTLHIIKRLSFVIELFPQLFNEKLCEQLLSHLKNLVEVCVSAATQIQQGAKPNKKMDDVIGICAAIINIFHLIPAASTKLIEPLIQMVLKVENALLTTSSFRKPLLKFLVRFPSQTVDYFLSHISISHTSRLFVYFLQQEDAKALRGAIEASPLKLVNSTFLGTQSQAEEQAANHQNKLELQFQGILIVRLLVKFNDEWLSHNRVLIGHLRRIWTSESFQDRIKKDGVPVHRWREPKLLVKCLLNYVKHRPSEVELLFELLRVFTHRHIPDFKFLKTFMKEDVAKNYTVEQKRAVFFKFADIVHDENFPQDLTAKTLQYIIIPMFVASFEKGASEIDMIIGGPPNPEQDSEENVISVFVSRVIDPDNPFKTSDAVRILLLQFSALLVEHASQHIHDANNKKQGRKLRRMMTFAWPCLLPNKQCVDPATKYHGHLLLAHIISKFAIHRKIVLQVFHRLLKAHAAEARFVVRQALAILTPAVPIRMDDGFPMLAHWTKKIIVEDGHTLLQLVHMLQLLVRHYKVYYPVRNLLIQHMITAMQKLGFTSSATIENRRLAVDLANVIIEWEIRRTKEEQQETSETKVEEKETPTGAVKRSADDSTQEQEQKRIKTTTQVPVPKDGSLLAQQRAPVDKHHADAVVNFLLRIACQVNEASTTVGSPGEALSKRCVLLLKTALKPGFWQGTDLKLTWLDKLFVTLDQTPGTNFNNVCTGLEILTYLLTVVPRADILPLLKPLQRGVVACMTCQNNKVIRAVHTFLTKLTSLFPIESVTVTNKYEELEHLYTNLGKVIYEGLGNYAKSATQVATSTLQGPLMFLKAAYTSCASYIDRLINPCIRALQKMHKDHIGGSSVGDMLITCVDLVKSRLGAMDSEARKLFIFILAQLIEKSPDAKLLKAITKVTEEWIKARVTPQNQQHLPTLREKAILLCRMMPNYEKRFPEDFELHAQYLELINYVYRDDSLLATELAAKLEPAFMSGLKCIQPQIRSHFMEVFDQSVSKKLYERLLYIFCSQNWESMRGHFWIKQCIELLLAAAACDRQLHLSSTFNKLPSLTSILKISSNPEAIEILQSLAKTSSEMKVKEEPMETDSQTDSCEQLNFLFSKESSENIFSLMEDATYLSSAEVKVDTSTALKSLVKKHHAFLSEQQKIKSTPFLGALAQLCHRDTNLSHDVWVNLFPELWKLLKDKQQQILAGELSPFMCSGTNCVQLDSHPSVVHTVLQSILRCEPSIPIRPSILKYLGKSHNQWHLSTLVLEDYVTLCEEYVNPPLLSQQPQLLESVYEEDVSHINPQETLDALGEMYSLINEEDMWAGLWLRRARYQETATAIAYENQGFFEQAQSTYEQGMNKARDEHTRAPASAHALPEYRLWEDHWIKCSQELGQWDLLMEFGKSKGNNNPFLVLESAWRVPDWPSMKEALAQVEKGFPDSILYKHDLYRAYIEICHPDEQQHLKMRDVEKCVETSSAQAIRLWKRLPRIISHQHISLLQASQQIVELQEAAQIRDGIHPQKIGRNTSLHDMKAIIKTWKNRLPMISDDLSHWSDIFLWRHHHYEAIVSAYDAQHDQTNHSMQGVHASAWSIIHYGQVARKQSLSGVCLDSLSRIHTIPSVPIVDCFQKIRQQVKCYLQMAGTMRKQELQEGLEVIESTNLKYFTKEMTAEFYALKGTFLAQIGRSEDANKAFSQAVQMHDNLIKGWALWGDYLDNIFVKERTMTLGVYAIICYMHACRNPNEAKCRKYLARTIWLLTYDDEKSCLAEALEKYYVGVPPVHWLPWVPQLLSCLTRKEGSKISSLLLQIGRVHAQAVYFPIRTLYLTLKLEHREKHKLESNSIQKGNKQGSVSTPTTTSAPGITASAGATTVTTTSSTSTASQDEKTESSTTTATSADTAAAAAAKPSLSQNGTADSTSTGNTSKPSETTAATSTANATTQGSLGQSGGEAVRVTHPMWLCSRIMHALRDLHPTLLAALEGIVDQMVWFRECWHEDVLRQLRQVLTKCYQVAFETRTDVSNAKITPHTMSFVNKLVSTFGVGFEFGCSTSQQFSSTGSESLARRAHATAQDPMFQKLKEQFTADFDLSSHNSMGLHHLIAKLKKWIKILEAKTKLLSSSFLLEERCRFLSMFSISTADVELPGEFLMPKSNIHSHYSIRIAQFMPRVELVQKHNMSARRLFIRANNGKIYPYLVVNDACLSVSRSEERVLQLLRILNLYFEKRKESSKRHLLFTVPRVVAVSPQMRLIEDSPSAVTLKDVMKSHYVKKGIDENTPVSLYYERLAAVQGRGEQSTHQVLRDIFKEIQSTIVPEVVLKEWAQRTYQDSAEYWTFRKQFTTQLTLLQFAEFTLHLSRLSPEMLQIIRTSGRLNVGYYKFEIDDNKGELDANRPVPFRLTPNISEFISPVGIGGVLTSSMVAAARCLVDPKFSVDSILRAILRDEMISWHKKKHDAQLHSNVQSSSEQIDNEVLINLVNGAVGSIMTRLQNLAEFEGAETKVTTLVGAAMSPDNLCRMDPAWHPWL